MNQTLKLSPVQEKPAIDRDSPINHPFNLFSSDKLAIGSLTRPTFLPLKLNLSLGLAQIRQRLGQIQQQSLVLSDGVTQAGESVLKRAYAVEAGGEVDIGVVRRGAG